MSESVLVAFLDSNSDSIFYILDSDSDCISDSNSVSKLDLDSISDFNSVSVSESVLDAFLYSNSDYISDSDCVSMSDSNSVSK